MNQKIGFPADSLNAIIHQSGEEYTIKENLTDFTNNLERMNEKVIRAEIDEIKNKGTIIGVTRAAYTHIYTRGKNVISTVRDDIKEGRYGSAIYNSIMGVCSMVNGVNTVLDETDKVISGSSSLIKSALTGLALVSSPVITTCALVVNLVGMYHEMNMVNKEIAQIKEATESLSETYKELNEKLYSQDKKVIVSHEEFKSVELETLGLSVDKIMSRQDLNNFYDICSGIELGRELMERINHKKGIGGANKDTKAKTPIPQKHVHNSHKGRNGSI